MMRLLLLGHGRMGRLVESLAPEYGATITAIVTGGGGAGSLRPESIKDADVAIDFTIADAVPHNLRLLADAGINAVIGTTGWKAREAELRDVVSRSNIGVLVGANFSLGMNIFQLVVEEAARRFSAQPSYETWIHEWHHSAKKDAPSGTALQLKGAMEQAGYSRRIEMSSTRAGSIPGTHEVGFDGPADTVTLTHTVRDRAVFARGALEAARWLLGKRGWFTVRDMLEDRGRQEQHP
jgi:4-hydroxy-tetrahydrodipicolinate reductase